MSCNSPWTPGSRTGERASRLALSLLPRRPMRSICKSLRGTPRAGRRRLACSGWAPDRRRHKQISDVICRSGVQYAHCCGLLTFAALLSDTVRGTPHAVHRALLVDTPGPLGVKLPPAASFIPGLYFPLSTGHFGSGHVPRDVHYGNVH